MPDKDMESKKYNIIQSANDLRINPSDRVWNRLEKRLDQDQDKIKISTLRKWMGIAAGMLIILSLFILITVNKSQTQQFVIHDLEPLPESALASYQFVSQLNEIYEKKTWVNFSEGNRKRLKSPSPDGGINGDSGENL